MLRPRDERDPLSRSSSCHRLLQLSHSRLQGRELVLQLVQQVGLALRDQEELRLDLVGDEDKLLLGLVHGRHQVLLNRLHRRLHVRHR